MRVTGAERLQSTKRALAHGCGLDAQQQRNIVVAATLAQDQRQRGALIGRQLIEQAHGQGTGRLAVCGVEPGSEGSVGYRGRPMTPPTVEELNRWITGFDRLYGLRFTTCSEELVRGEVAVRDELKQPLGLVHGGLYAAIAETLASLGTALAVAPDGDTAMGQSNSTSFLRPITAGTVHAVARRRHRGRTTWLWDVEITDDDGRLCALTRMTIAVRPQPR